MDVPNHLHLLVPGLSFIHESSFAKDLYLPALQILLGRATRQPLHETTVAAWLAAAFGLSSAREHPVAPFSLLAENGDPGEAFWLKADPVHLRVHGDQLVLLDSSMLNIEASETEALIATLNQHFRTDGLKFLASSADSWYVSTEKQNIITSPISEIMGKNVNQYLPSGNDGAKWNSISNEIQMLLFSHPINQERENNQKLTINSVWFSGGGTLSSEVYSPYPIVFTDNLFAKGLGLAAKAEVQPQPTSATTYLSSAKSGQHYLLTIESLEKAAQYGDIPTWRAALLALEEQWFKPLLHALKQNKLAAISILAFGANKSCEFKIQRGDLWKFWRRQI